MCTIFVIRERLGGFPLVIAANRDEMLVRQWSGPERIEGSPGVVCPRDAAAGGTWIGVNDAGLVVAITNRVFMGSDSTRRSRGWLCREALGQRSPEAAQAFVRRQVGSTPYNPFNLFVGGPGAAWALEYADGELTQVRLEPGVHVLTSHHDLNPTSLSENRAAMGAAANEARADPGSFARLASEVLADHRVFLDGYAVCKHGDTYGTRSAAVIGVRNRGEAYFAFAPGRPCEHNFEPVNVVVDRAHA